MPTLFVSAGNLLFASESTGEPRLDGDAEEVALQQRWQAETLATILGRQSLLAAVPGPADLRNGAPALLALAKRGGLHLLDAARAPAQPAAASTPGTQPAAAPAQGFGDSLLVTLGGVRVGVWGLRDPSLDASGAAAPSDLRAQAAALTKQLRARGAQLVVGLITADARAARRVAGAVSGLDFLVQGGSDRAEVPPPERIGTTTLLRAAHRGHGLLVVDLTRVGDGPFADQSAWTRQAQRQALQREAAELASRIEEWQRDPSVDRTLLAQQQARLAQMRARLADGEPPQAVAGNAFSARFVELGPGEREDPETRKLLDAYNKRINEHNREALAHLLPRPAPPGTASYIGSERCGSCHAAALAWWKGQAHGHAYATLVGRDSQYNLSCVGCHVTGYNQPGGSTVVHNQGLTNVGCESCHGPGSLHAADPHDKGSHDVRRQVPEEVCRHCHNPEHSDRFSYAVYEPRLLAPGHGLPAKGTASPAAPAAGAKAAAP